MVLIGTLSSAAKDFGFEKRSNSDIFELTNQLFDDDIQNQLDRRCETYGRHMVVDKRKDKKKQIVEKL